MSKRYIILQPVGQFNGRGVASLAETTVTVSLSGTDEELDLFFLSGKEKIDAGRLRGGFAKSFELSAENVKKIDSVVLFKDDEPVVYGSVLASGVPLEVKKNSEGNEKKENKPSPLGYADGFTWERIDDGSFAESCPMIRHIFENIAVIGRINEAGYYYFGKNGEKRAVAIPSADKGKNPFLHIAECARYINGCWTVGADKKGRFFYSLTD